MPLPSIRRVNEGFELLNNYVSVLSKSVVEINEIVERRRRFLFFTEAHSTHKVVLVMGIEEEMGISGGEIQDALMMSVDEKDDLIDKDEVNIRRMKNRERQRRYRARKRMREEAGSRSR
ncbi:hypothetical protein HA466_0263590 [Hirschfeldia incana]|nr:hypothetical protein HA466_0263590 [Hirschfeldia incana]